MADRLARYQRAPVRCGDAVETAWREFAAQREAAGYPAIDEETRPDYLISVSFLVSYNEDTTCWAVDFYERQAPYNEERCEDNIVFEMEIDAFTGEIWCAETFHDTEYRRFLQAVDDRLGNP